MTLIDLQGHFRCFILKEVKCSLFYGLTKVGIAEDFQ